MAVGRTLILWLGLVAACSVDGTGSGLSAGGTAGSTAEGTSADTAADGGAATSADGTADAEGETGAKFDVFGGGDLQLPPGSACKVLDDMNAVGECEEQAPADSFAPEIQWSFGRGLSSIVTPLVANLTDDNDDGEIDLCDVPDVVLVAGSGNTICDLYVLDGETGAEHFVLLGTEHLISCQTTPALGDIDGDGLVEIVTGWVSDFNDPARLKAFEHDGTPKWTNMDGGSWVTEDVWTRAADAVALHDLDADGTVEVVFDHEVYDADGNLLWWQPAPEPWQRSGSVGVDLDGDGAMEVVTGHSAYHADGTVYWDNYPTIPTRSIPQIADLDGDGLPEVFVTSGLGLFLVEHDGEITYGPVTPTGIMANIDSPLTWLRPGTVHDFDGDEQPEWASSSREYYAVYEGPAATDILWQAMVSDQSGSAAGTAFDFLGDGIAEAMYADEGKLRVYDGLTGNVLLEADRSSSTYFEYPTVADVDNDGSAEILVVSASIQPALQVLRDADERWIQARRIWNQHSYYVTNVREDGTIPTVPIDNWATLNTYRTQAQIQGGDLCKPVPEG